MGVIVWRDVERETVEKVNDDGGWSFDGVVLWWGATTVGGASMAWCSGGEGDKIEAQLIGGESFHVEMIFYSSGG
jgi:hypothetical protein